jgi:mRNA interferase MazF
MPRGHTYSRRRSLSAVSLSDLSQAKLRPAIVLADVGRDDWILCQITSNPYGDPRALPLADTDFATGSLHVASYARPGKLFTAHQRLMVSRAGQLQPQPFQNIVNAVIQILRSSIKS